jgi:dihydrofolate reductase
MLSLIVAMAKNRVIGNKGTVPWHITEDYMNFSKITKGHPIIMGRKTHESISGFTKLEGWDSAKKFEHKLLPDRTNIIVTRQNDYVVEGAIVVNSVEKALEEAGKQTGSEEIFIIGGYELYKDTINIADKVYLTLIDENVEGDTFFPEFENKFELSEDKKRIVRVNDKEIRYFFRVYKKIKNL